MIINLFKTLYRKLFKQKVNDFGFAELKYKGMPVVWNEDTCHGSIYLLDKKQFNWKQHLRKNGTPDMRYRVNHIEKLHEWEIK